MWRGRRPGGCERGLEGARDSRCGGGETATADSEAEEGPQLKVAGTTAVIRLLQVQCL